MRISLILTMAMMLSIFSIDLGQTQNQSESPYVYQVIAAKCSHEPFERTQTGFHAKGLSGIVTALHGVVDCVEFKAISSAPGGGALVDLYLDQVDIDRDVALLQSRDFPSILSPAVGLETSEQAVTSERAYALGHPYGMYSQLKSTLQIRDVAIRELRSLMPSDPDVRLAMDDRKSPRLETQVLSIEGHLVPGLSGAPIILDPGGQVVGVGNGGLQGGATEIVWAIPWRDISWTSVSQVQERFIDLRGTDPGLVFSFPQKSVSAPSADWQRLRMTIKGDGVTGPGIEFDQAISTKEPTSRYLVPTPPDIDLTQAHVIIQEPTTEGSGSQVLAEGRVGTKMYAETGFQEFLVSNEDGLLILTVTLRNITPTLTSNGGTSYFSFSGDVIDAENQEAVVGALVELSVRVDNKLVVFGTESTDDKGLFIFTLPRSYREFSGRIQVAHPFYRTAYRNIVRLGSPISEFSLVPLTSHYTPTYTPTATRTPRPSPTPSPSPSATPTPPSVDRDNISLLEPRRVLGGAHVFPAWSDDGATLVLGGYPGLELYDGYTLEYLESIPGGERMLAPLAFSPDGRWLAALSWDLVNYTYELQLWNMAEGRVVHNLGDMADLEWDQLDFSPDGRWLAVADGELSVYEVSSGRKRPAGSLPEGDWQSLDFLADTYMSILAIGGSGAEEDSPSVLFWDMNEDELVESLPYTIPVRSLAFSPDGERLATASGEEVIVWDMADFDRVHTWSASYASALTFSPDGHRLAAIADGLPVWDMASGELIFRLPDSEGDVEIESPVFSPDGERVGGTIVRSSSSGAVGSVAFELWDIDSKARVWSSAPWVFPDVPASLLFRPVDGTLLVVKLTLGMEAESTESLLEFWDPESGQRLKGWPYAGLVSDVDFSPDGAWLAVGEAQPDAGGGLEVAGTLRLVGADEGEIGWSRVGGLWPRATFSPDGRSIATWDGGAGLQAQTTAAYGTVTLLDSANGRVIKTLDQPGTWVQDAAFSPDGEVLVTGGTGDLDTWTTGSLWAWDVGSGQRLRKISQDLGGVVGVAFSLDGDRLAVTSVSPAADASGVIIHLLDARRNYEPLWSQPLDGLLFRLTFNAAGDVLMGSSSLGDNPDLLEVGLGLFGAGLSGTGLGTYFWEASSGQPLGQLGGDQFQIVAALSPDGRWIASAGQMDMLFGSVRLWSPP
jgi:WD40 repeat protein